MTDDSSEKQVCAVCRQSKPIHDLTPAELLRPALHEMIHRDCADWNSHSWICHADLHRFTAKLIENMLTEERGELGRLDVEVLASLRENELTVKNINEQLEGQYSFGGWMGGGSGGGLWLWTVIGVVIVVLLVIVIGDLSKK